VHEVKDIFPGIDCKTRVFMSDKAEDSIIKFAKKHRPAIPDLLQKLKRYAQNGFANYEGSDKPIRSEGGGVFRFGNDNTRFRLVGFYEDQSRTSFIGIEFYLKSGQAGDVGLIASVREVRSKRRWRKKDEYPKLAKYS
jgi:hypothetical protein